MTDCSGRERTERRKAMETWRPRRAAPGTRLCRERTERRKAMEARRDRDALTAMKEASGTH